MAAAITTLSSLFRWANNKHTLGGRGWAGESHPNPVPDLVQPGLELVAVAVAALTNCVNSIFICVQFICCCWERLVARQFSEPFAAFKLNKRANNKKSTSTQSHKCASECACVCACVHKCQNCPDVFDFEHPKRISYSICKGSLPAELVRQLRLYMNCLANVGVCQCVCVCESLCVCHTR